MTTRTTGDSKYVPKLARPETLCQAQKWQWVLNRYKGAGLCDRCAAQAAWGHQIGFRQSHPPCETCSPIVAGFPTKAVYPWRKLTYEDARTARDASDASS